jgi:hypothetical protein
MSIGAKFQTVGTILTVAWALKSLIAYHTWTLDEVMDDVASSPLPLNENGLEYWRNIVAPYYDLGPVKKRSKMRAHTVITSFIAMGLCLQFIKRIRQTNLDFHRYVGRFTLALTLIAYPHFVKLLEGFSHQTAKYMEAPVLFMIPYYAIRGWQQIRNKQVMEHRASMIMFASCFYYFGVSRLVMMAMNVIHSGPWAKYTGLGDWKDWSTENVDDFFGISIAIGFPLTFGVAAYNAYYGPNAHHIKKNEVGAKAA